VTNSSNRTLPQSKPPNRTRGIDEDEDEEEVADDIVVEEESAEFDEIMVWGHESLPDAEDDPYIKGIQEWIQLAEKVFARDPILDMFANLKSCIPRMTYRGLALLIFRALVINE
jgi:hypothetical protein